MDENQPAGIAGWVHRLQAEVALDALVGDGLGQWMEPVAGPKGGLPARTFVLHPTPDTTDTTSDGQGGESDTSADTTGGTPQKPNGF